MLVEPINDHFWFAHTLVADTVAQQLLGRQRRRLHERALEAHAGGARRRPCLAGPPRRPVPGTSSRSCRSPAPAPGAYLDRGASFQALRLASHALEEEPDDVELLRVATDAAWRLDFLDEALGYGRRWRALATDDVDRVEAQRFLTRLLHEQGTDAERDRALDELVLMAETLPDGQARGRAFGAIAQIMMLARRGDDAVAWADRAIDAARRRRRPLARSRRRSSSGRRRRSSSGVPARTAWPSCAGAYEAAIAVGDDVLTCRALSNGLNLMVAHSAEADAIRAELRGAHRVGRLRQARRPAARLPRRRRSVRPWRPAGLSASRWPRPQQYGGDWSRDRIQATLYACRAGARGGSARRRRGAPRRHRRRRSVPRRLRGGASAGCACAPPVSSATPRWPRRRGGGCWSPRRSPMLTYSLDDRADGRRRRAARRRRARGGSAPSCSTACSPTTRRTTSSSLHTDGLLLAAGGDHAAAVARPARRARRRRRGAPPGRRAAPPGARPRCAWRSPRRCWRAATAPAALAAVRHVVDVDLANWPGLAARPRRGAAAPAGGFVGALRGRADRRASARWPR